MADIYTHYCEDLDPAALQIVWDLVKRQPVDRPKAGLAFLNVQSYVMGKILGQPGPAPVFANQNVEDTDAVFQKAMEWAKEHKSKKTSPKGLAKKAGKKKDEVEPELQGDSGDWLRKLAVILMKILPLIFEELDQP